MDAVTTHFENSEGTSILLPDDLASFYGMLVFALQPGRPYIITNFVSSLDGVVTLNVDGHSGGGDISGFNPQDRAIMGLLRATASAVIVGAAQLRQPPGTRWTAEHICPEYAQAYSQLRKTLGLPQYPLQVIVSASGKLDFSLPIFQTDGLPVLLLTTPTGEVTINRENLPRNVDVQVVASEKTFGASQIVSAIQKIGDYPLLLIESGPGLVSQFFQESLLDELFLTFSPQVAGRAEDSLRRMGFVSGQIFAPYHPIWGRLISVKQAADHLFLRYRFITEKVTG